MATQLSNTGIEVAKVDEADIPSGGSDKVLLYASGSGSDTRLYVKAGADSQKQLGVDIDQYSALGGTGLHQTQDHFLFSDNGTEKKITFSNLQDAIFADVSGDATVAAGGALTIAATSVENGMLAGSIADSKLNTITTANKVSLAALDIDGATALGGASVAQADLLVIDDGAGGTNKSVTFSNFEDSIFGNISGDATVAAGGALTIAAGAVEGSMLADDCISAQGNLGGTGVADADEFLFSDNGTLKALTGANLYGWVFSKVSGDATVASGGGLTIANDAVEQAMIADDAVGADQLAANAVVNASIASGAAIDMDKLDGGSLASSLSDLAQGDLMIAADVDDSNALKSITFSNLEDAIFGNVSGDATIAAGGALTIAATSVENGMLAGSIANAKLANSSVTVGGSAVSLGGTITGANIAAALNSDIGGNFTIGNQSDDQATFTGAVVIGGDLTVQGTTTTVDSTTVHVSSSFTFEGPVDAHETTLGVVDPTADATINLPAMSAGTYYLPVMAAASTTAIDATPAEINAIADASARSAATVDVGADHFMFCDGGATGAYKVEAIADLVDAMAAGVGLAASSGIMALDINGLAAAAVDVASDSIAIVDADGSNLPKKEAISDLVDAIAAGAGLAASSGVMSVNIDGLSALGGTGLHQTQDHFMFSDNGTEKKITFSNLQDAVFADVSGDAAIAAGGALTIASDAVEQSMIADDAVGADQLAANAVVNASVASGAAIALSKIDTNVDMGGDFTVGNQSNDRMTVTGPATVSGDLTLGGGTGALAFSAASSIAVADNTTAALAVADAGGQAYLTFHSNNAAPGMLASTNLFLSASGGAGILGGNLGLASDRQVGLGCDSNGFNPEAYITHDSSNDRLAIIASASYMQVDGASDYACAIDSGTKTETIGTAYNISCGSMQLSSATSDRPVFELLSSNADANPATLKFNKNTSDDSEADNDELGEIVWYGDDDGGNATEFATFKVYSPDVSNASEDAKMEWAVLVGGTARAMTYDSSGLTLLNDSGYGKVTAHSFVTYSDESLKTNVSPMGDALSTVKKLQGVTYDWKDDGKNDIGFIAQEVAKVVPEVVTSTGNEGHFAMDYARLTAVLVEGMKEQQKQIEDLKNVVVKLSSGKTVNAKMATVKVPSSTELLSEATSAEGEKLLADKYGWSDEG